MENHGDRHGLKSMTIKSVLRNKVNGWIETITDENLRDACKREAIVTGGSIASMLLGAKQHFLEIMAERRRFARDSLDHAWRTRAARKLFWLSRGIPSNQWSEK